MYAHRIGAFRKLCLQLGQVSLALVIAPLACQELLGRSYIHTDGIQIITAVCHYVYASHIVESPAIYMTVPSAGLYINIADLKLINRIRNISHVILQAEDDIVADCHNICKSLA